MSFFHCCLLDRKGCADDLNMKQCVLKIGKWTRTFNLPGYWKYMARLNWEPANVEPGPRPVATYTPPVFATMSTGGTMTYTASSATPIHKPPRTRHHDWIRFSSDALERIKPVATEDGVTVSTWVRNLVERELRQRTRHAA